MSVWRPWLWFVLLGLVLASYGLAVASEEATTTTTTITPAGKSVSMTEAYTPSLAYRLVDSLKIFPSGFPGYDTAQPWDYNFARYLAGFVFLLASFQLLAIAFSDRVAEARAARRHGHVVVCGLGDTGLRSVRAFRAEGAKVTSLDTDPAGDGVAEARAEGALVLARDATQLSSLDAARVDGASAVVCSCGDDATNTRMAALVATSAALTKRDDGLDVYVRVENPELAQVLRGRMPVAGPTIFHFFSVGAVWARAMLDDPSGPFSGTVSEPPRIVILGTNELASAVAVGASRRWHAQVRHHGCSGRAEIVVCGVGAESTCATVADRHPAIASLCMLSWVEHATAASFPREFESRLTGSAPMAIYACADNPGDRLAAAFDALNYVEFAARIFLPATAAAAILTPPARTEQIRIVDLSRVASVDLIHDQMRDRLAREAHAVWFEKRRQARDFGAQPSDKPWTELPDDYRRASYAHVQGISEQLQAVWYEIEPLADWDERPEELAESAVEAMAELEHNRWCRERRAAGWRFGLERNNRRRLHPMLVPWTDLSEEKRNLDRELIRRRPAILAGAGYRLARSPARERLARILHERYGAEQNARAIEVAEWADLSAFARATNLAAVDDIAVKLARIGCRAAPQALGVQERGFLTEAEVEQLAKSEHDRWLHERFSDGWTPGPRDDVAKTHPSLVAWEDLGNQERQKDRGVVRAIPDLLAAVGLMIVRDA